MIHRLRKFLLIAGTATSLLIAAAFVTSAFLQVAVQLHTWVCVYIVGGSVTIVLDDPLSGPIAWERNADGLFRWDAIATDWRSFVEFPLFTLFAAVAVMTLLVGRFVPKFPPGHCRKCGYNLKGLIEERCPECGTEFGRRKDDDDVAGTPLP